MLVYLQSAIFDQRRIAGHQEDRQVIAHRQATPAVSRHRERGQQWFLIVVLPTVLAMSVLLLSSAARGATDPLSQGSQLAVSLEQTAQRVTRDLTARGYLVERGYPMLVTQQDCDQYTFPIMRNCFANNPASPYVVPVVKSWEDEFVDPATVNAFGKTRRGYSATYRLDPREAIIIFAELPPPGRYTGLQTWVFTKEWLTEDAPWDDSAYKTINTFAPALVDYLFATVPYSKFHRIQSASTLSNNINNVVIERQSKAAFGQTRYFIITPDQAMDRAVRTSLALGGVPDEDVFTEQIPPSDEIGDIGPLGLDAKANDFVTALRYAMPDNEHAAHAWWTKLPLTVLRVRERPSSDRPPEPFPPFVADERTAAPEGVYRDDFKNLVRQVCQRWGHPCDPDNPDRVQLRGLIDLQDKPVNDFGPQCRAVGMNCILDGQDASYFTAPASPLDPGWVYAIVGTLGTATGNATYVGLSVNDVSKLKGVLNISDIDLAGSAAWYEGTVQNTDKFFVHYFTRDCRAIEGLTDGQCTTVTEDMVPPLGEGKQGLFTAALRSYIRPGTARGPLSSEQLRPMIIRFAQP
jgi:hypothetical protein